MRLVVVKYCSQRELLSWSDVQYSTSQNTNNSCLTANDWIFPRYPGTTVPHHIISLMVTLARLNLPQIARKAKHPPHEAKVKSLDFHR